MQTQYPNFEVIAVNDGSRDKTAEILNELLLQYPKLRVVHLAENQGKAYALRAGAMVSQNEYLVVLMVMPYYTACCVMDDVPFDQLSSCRSGDG